MTYNVSSGTLNSAILYHTIVSGDIEFITPDSRTIDNTQWSQTSVKNSHYFIPHLHLMTRLGKPHQNIATTFGTEKNRMVWLSDGKKILQIW